METASTRMTAAGLTGGHALIARAADGKAAMLRKRRGFTASRDDPSILFRSAADIVASLRSISFCPGSKAAPEGPLRLSVFCD